MSSSSYDKVKRAKLSFKGGLDPEKQIDKKKKKKKKNQTQKPRNPSLEVDEAEAEQFASSGGQDAAENKDAVELDTGIGHAPEGSKKSKHYEQLFPVETKRFGYNIQKTLTREEALDIRIKQKADRYCK